MSFQKQKFDTQKQLAAQMRRSAAKFKRKEWFWRIFWLLVVAGLVYLGIRYQVYRPVIEFISTINKESEMK